VDVERPYRSKTTFEKIGLIGDSVKRNPFKKQREELLTALQSRFKKNMNRHEGLAWAEVQAKLESDTAKLWSLY
jgi:Protein of unknown function (DUF4256)